MRRVALLLWAAMLALSCGSDRGANVARSIPPRLEDPDEFLGRVAAAYTAMDTAAYFLELDPAYVFEMRVDEWSAAGLSARAWDRAGERAVTRRLFTGGRNDEAEWVDEIRMGLLVRSVAEDRTDYPGRPPGETWYRVAALVEIDAVIVNPVEMAITTYHVLSPQSFVVRPDPRGTGRYLVARQSDEPPAAVDDTGSATSLSWGLLKARFYQ
ncbi:MAG: hypothetical protein ABIK65_01885 [Candidatus Eisenbacteria bacterium]